MQRLLPDALGQAIGQILAEQRKEWTRERERIETEARATIAGLNAEISNLKVANEMLRVDLRNAVDAEITRVRDAMALVKDGPSGPQGEPGKDAEVDYGLIMRELRDDLSQMVAGLPSPEPGPPGKDGRDGQDADQAALEALVKSRIAKIETEQLELAATIERDIRTASEAVISELRARMAELHDGQDGAEGPQGPQGERGPPGESVTAEEVASLVLERLPAPEKGDPGPPGEQGPQGEPGRHAELDLDYVNRTLADAVHERLEDLRGPQGERGESGQDGQPGRDGKDADPELIATLIDEKLAAAISELPPPEKGERGEPGRQGEPGEKGDRGEPGSDGRDGVGLASAFINRDGNLVVTLTDGTTRDLGSIVGKDGAPGRDGADGRDGLSFDAFTLEPEYDGQRTLRLRWTDAKGNQQTREWRLPIMLYREIYKADVEYEAGDAVRYGGSLWLATADTSEKPGDGCQDWRLVARAGRDGRDGAPGPKGEKGDRGLPGPERLVTGKTS